MLYGLVELKKHYGEYDPYSKRGPQRILGEYAANLKYTDLPKEVVDRVKLHTLHMLSIMFPAFMTENGKTWINIAKEMGEAKREATVIGEGSKLSAWQAAFANGCLADVMDWEDVQTTGEGHSGAVAWPVAFALGEKVKASGKDFITSIVASYEVTDRIECAIHPPARDEFEILGFCVSNLKSFTSAVVAGKLLNLDGNQMTMAIGIGGALAHPMTNVQTLRHRTDCYHGYYGWSSIAGIFAAEQVKRGITGGTTLLDDDKGIHRSIGYRNCKFNALTEGLGADYHMMRSIMKHWPAEFWIQSSLDAVDILVKKYDIHAEDIEQISLGPVLPFDLPPYYPDVKSPISFLDAQFSIPYCVAMLISGEKPWNWFDEKYYKDRRILNLMSKVKITGIIDAWDAYNLKWTYPYKWYNVTVEILAKGGRRFSETVYFPKGHPANLLSWDGLEAQFKGTASYIGIEKNKVDKAIQMIGELERLDDITKLADLLHK